MSLEAGIQCFDETMDTGRSRAGKNSQMKMVWVPRIQLWKEKKNYTFVFKTRQKNLSIRKDEAKFAVCNSFKFFFSNEDLKFCVIIHISSNSSVAWFPGEGTLCQKSRLIRSPWMPFRSEEFLGLSTCKCLQTQEFSPSLTDRNTPDHCRRKWPSLREQFTLQDVDLRKASKQFHWSLYFLVLNSMCSQFPLEIHSYLQNRKLLLHEKKKERKSTHLLTLILFLLISEQMVTYHNGSFIKISIF